VGEVGLEEVGDAGCHLLSFLLLLFGCFLVWDGGVWCGVEGRVVLKENGRYAVLRDGVYL
jgi:hypothetical protein